MNKESLNLRLKLSPYYIYWQVLISCIFLFYIVGPPLIFSYWNIIYFTISMLIITFIIPVAILLYRLRPEDVQVFRYVEMHTNSSRSPIQTLCKPLTPLKVFGSILGSMLVYMFFMSQVDGWQYYEDTYIEIGVVSGLILMPAWMIVLFYFLVCLLMKDAPGVAERYLTNPERLT